MRPIDNKFFWYTGWSLLVHATLFKNHFLTNGRSWIMAAWYWPKIFIWLISAANNGASTVYQVNMIKWNTGPICLLSRYLYDQIGIFCRKHEALQSTLLMAWWWHHHEIAVNGMCQNPKGTKTERNSEPLKILKKLKVLSVNWTYDFKKNRKNIFYDKILEF